MMTPTEVIAEMRNMTREDVDYGPWDRWADALEAAMREPVAEVIDTPYGPAMTGRHMLNIEDLPPGTKLYTVPPDQSAEIERLHGVIERAGKAWLSLEPPVPWEGDVADAMAAGVAEIERLREAVQKLLACPAIADEDFSDPEWGCEITREAEAFARAALAGKEGNGNE
jgi:hypothetical protein